MLTNIPRDIHRSVFKYIVANYTLTPVFIEGDTQRDKKVPYVELRMDGPWLKPESKNLVHCSFDVNILIQVSIMDSLYKISEIGGALLNILYGSIDIVDSDDTQLGCATTNTDRRNSMQLNRYGLIDPQSEIMQATVEVRFDVTLEI